MREARGRMRASCVLDHCRQMSEPKRHTQMLGESEKFTNTGKATMSHVIRCFKQGVHFSLQRESPGIA
jgi:hypothetical protein